MNNIETLKALIHMCDEQGDFRNGVTCPNGVLDEGSVTAGKIIQEAEEALKAVIADYERMEACLKEMDKYLDENKLNLICSTSIYHQQIKFVLKGEGDE